MQTIRGRKRAASPNNDNTTTPPHSNNIFPLSSSRNSGKSFGARRSAAVGTSSSKFQPSIVAAVIIILCSLVLGSFYLSYGILTQNGGGGHSSSGVNSSNTLRTKNNNDNIKVNAAASDTTQQNKQDAAKEQVGVNSDKCAFRSYPKSRLYGLHDKSPPNFLTSDAMYIRGEWPVILNPLEDDNKHGDSSNNIQQSTPVKPCFDTTSWENLKERLPFTDGHNPSVVSLAANPYDRHDGQGYKHVRLDPKFLIPITSALSEHPLDTLFLGVTIFGNGQCKYGLSDEEVVKYNFSSYNDPPNGKRTVLAVMTPPTSLGDQQQRPFQILAQTTLLLERDATFGTHRRNKIPPEKKKDVEGFTRAHQEFDDPRFFFHEGRLWILYRNGPLFGYQDQIHNPIHFETVSPSSTNGGDGDGVKFVAYIKASETVRVCCGRNIALISEETRVVVGDDSGSGGGKKEVEWLPSTGLKALTWVDPVTVKDVNVADETTKLKKRQLSEAEDEPFDGASVEETSSHRRLGSAKPKSNIHGTNGYLVPLPSSGELLGIAHFHRPEHRKESNYALHGHHYTHAFFTIARQQSASGNGGNTAFKLKRVSNEFLFRSLSLPIGEKESFNDGDIIQFASGLDIYGSDIDGKLVLSYGINDCEGALLTISMQKLQQMLIEVDPGQEVVDLMKRSSSARR